MQSAISIRPWSRQNPKSRLSHFVLGNGSLSGVSVVPPRRQSQEEVSKPFEDSVHASQVEEALEQVGIVFPARDEPAEIVQPAETAFDPVAANVASDGTAILSRRLGAIRSMRTDQLDTTRRETVTKPIRIGRSVVQQTTRLLTQPREEEKGRSCVPLFSPKRRVAFAFP
jgi:hypothetical protein